MERDSDSAPNTHRQKKSRILRIRLESDGLKKKVQKPKKLDIKILASIVELDFTKVEINELRLLKTIRI